jgi:hypothetical protein
MSEYQKPRKRLSRQQKSFVFAGFVFLFVLAVNLACNSLRKHFERNASSEYSHYSTPPIRKNCIANEVFMNPLSFKYIYSDMNRISNEIYFIHPKDAVEHLLLFEKHQDSSPWYYYQLLSVPIGASQDEIQKTYRKKSLLFHPDKLPKYREELMEKYKDFLLDEFKKERKNDPEKTVLLKFDEQSLMESPEFLKFAQEKLDQKMNHAFGTFSTIKNVLTSDKRYYYNVISYLCHVNPENDFVENVNQLKKLGVL